MGTQPKGVAPAGRDGPKGQTYDDPQTNIQKAGSIEPQEDVCQQTTAAAQDQGQTQEAAEQGRGRGRKAGTSTQKVCHLTQPKEVAHTGNNGPKATTSSDPHTNTTQPGSEQDQGRASSTQT